MKITDIHVDGFGVWNTMVVDELSTGVTLFFGRNEAGKTTLMQFLRAGFYGFSPDRRRCYLPPVYGGVPGGMLRVQNHSGDFVIERRQSETDPAGLGRVIVLAANGSRQGQHLLNVLLSGVDESIFNNVFAIGIHELQELATLNDTQAAEQLYNLANGVDRVSLVEVIRGLVEERRKILGDESLKGELAGLFQQREKLLGEVADLEAQTRRWFDLGRQRTALTDELTQLDTQIARLEHDSRTVEIAIQVRDKWRQRHEVSGQLRKIGVVDPLPEDCLARLDNLNLEIEQHKEQLEPLHKQRQQVKRELALQPINRALWDHSCRIEAICEHGPWIASLENEIQRIRKDVETSELELLQLDEKLAAEGGVQLAQAPVITGRVAQQLEAPAHSLRQSMQQRSLARKQYKKQQQEATAATSELRDELDGRPVDDFDQQLERAGELVKQLRKRVGLEDRLDQMARQREELEHESERLLDDQLHRMRMLVGIGIMFVFGFVLLSSSLFGRHVMPMQPEIAWGVGALGVFCMGFSALWKTMAEKASQEELDNVARRLDALDRDIQDTQQGRDQLDRQLPPGAGTFSVRLVAAEKELKELEGKAPLHFARHEAKQRTNTTKRHVAAADDELREARSRWRRALRNAGLPESLHPKQVRQLAAHHQRRAKIHTGVTEAKERLTKLEADRDSLVARLRQLNEDVGLSNAAPDPQLQLSQLATALSGQRDMVNRRRDMQREDRELRQRIGSLSQLLRRLLRAREAHFADLRVTDEDDLRTRWQKLQEIARLNERHRTLSEQIAAIIGGFCPETQVETELGSATKEELEGRHKALLHKLQDSQNRLGQAHQRRGEVQQEMKTLSENRRLGAAKFEIGCLEQRIERAVRRWQASGICVRMLEIVRERYEAERQPETLSEASLYLEKLTAGKYTRIWTPLGEHELRVDDHDGRPMSLEVLSRGTREAIFLSLRLALVAAYGRRGVNIPMILDDVLVNLDAQRAESAVRVLCDFAKEGRQLLFFTCHDHILKMFERATVDVRILPAHGSPGVRVTRHERLPEPAPIVEPVEPVLTAEPVEPPPAPIFAIPIEEPIVDPIPLPEPRPLPIAEDYALQDALDIANSTPLFDLDDYINDFEPRVIAEPIDLPAELVDESDVVYDEQEDEDAFTEIPWWETARRRFTEEESAA
ncbi:MAG: AAA family ATPase [Pirellulaceae bacterium]